MSLINKIFPLPDFSVLEWPEEYTKNIQRHCPELQIGELPKDFVKKISDKLDEYERKLKDDPK